jgi:hypothetical protein
MPHNSPSLMKPGCLLLYSQEHFTGQSPRLHKLCVWTKLFSPCRPQLDEHPLSVARNCLLNVFAGIPIFEDNGNFMFGTKFI